MKTIAAIIETAAILLAAGAHAAEPGFVGAPQYGRPLVAVQPAGQTFAAPSTPTLGTAVYPRVHAPACSLPAPPVYAAAPVPSYAYRPAAAVVTMPKTYIVGRGIIGQPTVYVPGQPVRNFFRWISP